MRKILGALLGEPQARVKGDPHTRQLEALRAIKGVSQTDAAKLLAHFGTLAKVFAASDEELKGVPGVPLEIFIQCLASVEVSFANTLETSQV